MTCIVGVEHEGDVWIGGDSAGVAGWSLVVRADTKVFKVDEFLYGIAGSFRGGNILRYGFTAPKRYEGEDAMTYLTTRYADALRAALSKSGSKEVDDGVDLSPVVFLMGYRGGLYGVYSDFQIARPSSGYLAIGCGGDVASGALYATRGKVPAERVELALAASEAHNGGVRAPFVIERLGEEPQ